MHNNSTGMIIYYGYNTILAVPHYVIRLYSTAILYITSTKKHLKMNKEIGMILPQKRVNTSGVGESNNYYEDIYNIYTSLQHSLTTPIDSTH